VCGGAAQISALTEGSLRYLGRNPVQGVAVKGNLAAFLRGIKRRIAAQSGT
jgi:hypothetical protein